MDNKKLDEWILYGETGISSLTMWGALKGIIKIDEPKHCRCDTPRDPSDFSRCYNLCMYADIDYKDLCAISKAIQWWKPMLLRWNEMVELYVAKDFKKLYEVLQEVDREAMSLDGWEEVSPRRWQRKQPQINPKQY